MVALVGSDDRTNCGCRKCWKERHPGAWMTFIVCDVCGNKRCPHAADHNNACTGSNEPGQVGSDYR
jgi:hypothetical protein